MSTTEIITIVIAILGSSGLWSLITTLISKKSGNTKKIEHIARDCNRTQLLLLMSDYPTAHQEILKVAEEYFVNLKGNWYMDSMFLVWLKDQGLEKPSWYTKK